MDIFFFTGDDRPSLDGIEIGQEASIRVRNEENEIVTISFVVTRNTNLSPKTRWVYGKVLGLPEGEYHQIEIKLNKDEPEMDTVEVFPQAPPISFSKLR